jgi:hypothetical protein
MNTLRTPASSRRFLSLAAAVLVLLMSLGMSGVASASTCVQEFDHCVVSRDCCEGLSCVTGDWQYTTDSTCLWPKSEKLEKLHLSVEQRLKLLEAFYTKVGVDKALDELDHLVKKYRAGFPKLVIKLERKYDTSFDVPEDGISD